MVRISMRGGVWRNSEDEVLKAAIMKYGLNNWSRVASLLVRKSAKQCKSRWYEFLDPHVNKAEWVREEDEKLLHLAKLFPCQWRTIAPLVGRTAHQCLERYERLLDQAQGRTEEELDRAAEIRRLRPGEIDPHPETKPSRADAVDLDEDEKEMLAEARARLANTRGKKAKRKARERHLEEARRLATLQKTREMKAAGLGLAKVSKKKLQEDSIDYYKEIPFETQPPKGFYDTAAENPETDILQAAQSLAVLERNTAGIREKRLRDADAARLKKLMDDDLPEANRIIEKMNRPSAMLQRTALDLPQPELSDRDLEGILAVGKTEGGGAIGNAEGHSAHLLMGAGAHKRTRFAGGSATGLLTSAPLTGIRDTTALLGPAGATTLVGPTATGLFGPATGLPADRGATGIYTSLTASAGVETPAPAELRKRAKLELADLPAPAVEVEIEAQSIGGETLKPPETFTLEEDAEEAIARKEREKRAAEAREWKTQVIQQNLPRPLLPDLCVFTERTDWPSGEDAEYLSKADRHIFEEMRVLVLNDALKYPLPVKGLLPPEEIPPLEAIDLDAVGEASAMIAAAVAERMEEGGSDGHVGKLSDEEFDSLIFGPDPFLYDQAKRVWVPAKGDDVALLPLYRDRFERLKSALLKETERAKQKETKLQLLIAGYIAKESTLKSSIKALREQLPTHAG